MQDARLALRNLARRPMFSAVAILTLALGIAPVVLGTAALVASYLPARRAAQISPLAALGR